MVDIKIRNVPDDLLWQIKMDAMTHHMTLRQWVLFVLGGGDGATVYIAPGATAPGQVDFGAQGKPEKNRRAASPPTVVTKSRQSGATISTLKTMRKGPTSLIADRSLELGIPAEIMGLQPTVADTYGGIARGAGPGLPPDPDTTSWTEAQWDDYYETHRIDPSTGGQYPNKEFCPLRESDSCNRYNTGGHCLRCR
jgi:hypothetical protein